MKTTSLAALTAALSLVSCTSEYDIIDGHARSLDSLTAAPAVQVPIPQQLAQATEHRQMLVPSPAPRPNAHAPQATPATRMTNSPIAQRQPKATPYVAPAPQPAVTQPRVTVPASQSQYQRSNINKPRVIVMPGCRSGRRL